MTDTSHERANFTLTDDARKCWNFSTNRMWSSQWAHRCCLFRSSIYGLLLTRHILSLPSPVGLTYSWTFHTGTDGKLKLFSRGSTIARQGTYRFQCEMWILRNIKTTPPIRYRPVQIIGVRFVHILEFIDETLQVCTSFQLDKFRYDTHQDQQNYQPWHATTDNQQYSP